MPKNNVPVKEKRIKSARAGFVNGEPVERNEEKDAA